MSIRHPHYGQTAGYRQTDKVPQLYSCSSVLVSKVTLSVCTSQSRCCVKAVKTVVDVKDVKQFLLTPSFCGQHSDDVRQDEDDNETATTKIFLSLTLQLTTLLTTLLTRPLILLSIMGLTVLLTMLLTMLLARVTREVVALPSDIAAPGGPRLAGDGEGSREADGHGGLRRASLPTTPATSGGHWTPSLVTTTDWCAQPL